MKCTRAPRGVSVASALGLDPEALLLNIVSPLAGPWACDFSLLGPLSSLWKASRPAHFCSDVKEDVQFFPVTLGTVPGAGRADFQGS